MFFNQLYALRRHLVKDFFFEQFYYNLGKTVVLSPPCWILGIMFWFVWMSIPSDSIFSCRNNSLTISTMKSSNTVKHLLWATIFSNKSIFIWRKSPYDSSLHIFNSGHIFVYAERLLVKHVFLLILQKNCTTFSQVQRSYSIYQIAEFVKFLNRMIEIFSESQVFTYVDT